MTEVPEDVFRWLADHELDAANVRGKQ